MKIIKLSTRIFLGLMALAFCKVGIEALVNPVPVLANVQIELLNTNALSSMRAVYGGMHFVFGLFCLYGIFKNPASALGLIVLYTAGFVLGRLTGIIVDGTPDEFVTSWLATETVSLLIAGFLLNKISQETIQA
jgi:hypothetical protein